MANPNYNVLNTVWHTKLYGTMLDLLHCDALISYSAAMHLCVPLCSCVLCPSVLLYSVFLYTLVFCTSVLCVLSL